MWASAVRARRRAYDDPGGYYTEPAGEGTETYRDKKRSPMDQKQKGSAAAPAGLVPNLSLNRSARLGGPTQDELLLPRPQHPAPVPPAPQPAPFTRADTP